MNVYLSSAFSINMLPRKSLTIDFIPCTVEFVKQALENHEYVSIIGHEDTAKAVSLLLGKDIPVNRQTIKLTEEWFLIVAQYRGDRLPEGATQLPPDAVIEFWKVF